jgi:hypothetical protein
VYLGIWAIEAHPVRKNPHHSWIFSFANPLRVPKAFKPGFDDAEAEDTPEMFWNLKWGDVKRTIEGWVRELSDRRAPPETLR